jgi:hypothetical protein
MGWKALLIVAAIWSVLPALARTGETTQTMAQRSNDAQDTASVSLGRLETRNHVMVIYAGEEGNRYTVTDKQGKVLGRYLTPAELQTRFPDLKRVLDVGGKLDASLGPKDGGEIRSLKRTLPTEKPPDR